MINGFDRLHKPFSCFSRQRLMSHPGFRLVQNSWMELFSGPLMIRCNWPEHKGTFCSFKNLDIHYSHVHIWNELRDVYWLLRARYIWGLSRVFISFSREERRRRYPSWDKADVWLTTRRFLIHKRWRRMAFCLWQHHRQHSNHVTYLWLSSSKGKYSFIKKP